MTQWRDRGPDYTGPWAWWWVRHGREGYILYAVGARVFTRHSAIKKKGKHFGMSMPLTLYKTKADLPTERREIELFPNLKR